MHMLLPRKKPLDFYYFLLIMWLLTIILAIQQLAYQQNSAAEYGTEP